MPAPSFRRIAIVGVGLIGGSIGLAARRGRKRLEVIGIDRAAVLRRARRRGAVGRAASSLRHGLDGADLVILALPVDDILRLLPEVARHAPRRAVITDVGSTKDAIARAARRAGLGRRFVGGHPMAGSEQTGVAHADARLFRGAAWILCPGRGGRRRPEVRRLARFVASLGARPAFLAPREHDEVVARLSHLAQLASVALVNAAARGAARRRLDLAGPGLRQMSRLASSSPSLWDGILRTNRRAAARALVDLGRELDRLRADLGRGTAAHFHRAARVRRRLAAASRTPA